MIFATGDVVDIGVCLSGVVTFSNSVRGKEEGLSRGEETIHQSQSGRGRRRSVRFHFSLGRKLVAVPVEHGLHKVSIPWCTKTAYILVQRKAFHHLLYRHETKTVTGT